MTDELIERVARAIYEADDPWHVAWPWPDLQADQAGIEHYRRIASAALASIDIAAQREDAARQALQAAAKDAETWFPLEARQKYPSFGVVASIRAIDPARFRGDSPE